MLKSEYTICGKHISELKPCSEKRVTLICNTCEKETTVSYANYRNSQNKKGNTGETNCIPCTSTANAKKRIGQPSPFKGVKRPELQGPNSPGWKSGSYITSDGYIMIYVGHDYTKYESKWGHYRKEHMYVIENSIGRLLEDGEVVHHINGVKIYNDLDNLFLTDISGHRNAHQSLQEIGYLLTELKLIKFDKALGKYYIDKELEELCRQNMKF